MRRYNTRAKTFLALSALTACLTLFMFTRVPWNGDTLFMLVLLGQSTALMSQALGETEPPPGRDLRPLALAALALLLAAAGALRVAMGWDVLRLDAGDRARLVAGSPGAISMIAFVVAVLLLTHVGQSYLLPFFPRLAGQRRTRAGLALGLAILLVPPALMALSLTKGLVWSYLHAAWIVTPLAVLAAASVLAARRFDRPPAPLLPPATARR